MAKVTLLAHTPQPEKTVAAAASCAIPRRILTILWMGSDGRKNSVLCGYAGGDWS